MPSPNDKAVDIGNFVAKDGNPKTNDSKKKKKDGTDLQEMIRKAIAEHSQFAGVEKVNDVLKNVIDYIQRRDKKGRPGND